MFCAQTLNLKERRRWGSLLVPLGGQRFVQNKSPARRFFADSRMWSALKGLDAYPKLSEAVQVKTLSGGIVSISACAIMFLLFCSELAFYMSTVTRDHLIVDTTRSARLNIYVDVRLPAVPCSLLSMDLVDATGATRTDVFMSVVKRRMKEDGTDLGIQEEPAALGGVLSESAVLKAVNSSLCKDCYGAHEYEGQCCNTCEDVKAAYRKKGWALSSVDHIEQCKEKRAQVQAALGSHEGCRVKGHFTVEKSAGNFHLAPGEEFQSFHDHDHDMQAFEAGLFNVSHMIDKFSFGEEFPGIINPLDATRKIVKEGGAVFQYYVKVVPTTYEYLDGRQVVTNQFSVTEHTAAVKDRQGLGLPGIFFHFDISPIKVQFKEERRSFAHFLTQLCAIIGGVYTVSSLIDKLLYSSMRSLQKTRIGKYG